MQGKASSVLSANEHAYRLCLLKILLNVLRGAASLGQNTARKVTSFWYGTPYLIKPAM